jgi:hypothetical protein
MQAMVAAGVVSNNDPYFNLTTLLLNTTATNGAQNNTFLDSSTNNFTITRNGNTTQGTFTPFSQTGWSNFFDGATNSYLALPSNTAFAFGTGAYTVEGWLYQTARSTNEALFFGANGGSGYLAYITNTGAVNSGSITGSAGDIPLNTWCHVAYVRSSTGSNDTKIYVNGVLKATGTDATDWTSSGDPRIGMLTANTNYAIKGYISNFRIVKGTAVYTSAFTPSTTPLTAISGTSVLTCQSNRFLDISTNAFTVTPTGTMSVQAFSPFAPTAAYDAAVVGGSGYFDGTGDYLTVGSGTDVDLGTSDFMIEAWYYCLANGTYVSGVISKRVGGAASGWGMTTSGFVCDMAGTWYDSWGNPFWVGSTSATGFNSGTSLQKLNQWTHIVVTRQGTDARWFVNGQLLGYFSRTGAIQQLTGSPLAVGLNGTTAEQPFIGFLSNCRVVVGSVPTGYQTSSTTLNTQIFTPPTAPVTTTSQGATSANVKYIGNFINSGIFDSTAKNVAETVGNAQASTTQAKWGTTSMYFDGTGDALLPPASKLLAFNTGDFTAEVWIYPIAWDSNMIVMQGGSNGFGIQKYSSGSTGNIGVIINGGWVITDATLPTTGQWTHIAVTRSGSTLRFFVNGVVSGSTPTNTADISDGIKNIGGQAGETFYYGYMDDLRITKGYARYTANFSVPAAAFPLQ